ncbi:wd40 repeat family [Anaeramoeba flamelloides]|uniref:Wd40 repeat family n=1 Tax=Anaeramoeba flamelloides TaxID=1746091 RepID=A0ABQ8XX51_9EUKA|nr:wd40 repeat family [Anaeramoeba flamelloides]
MPRSQNFKEEEKKKIKRKNKTNNESSDTSSESTESSETTSSSDSEDFLDSGDEDWYNSKNRLCKWIITHKLNYQSLTTQWIASESPKSKQTIILATNKENKNSSSNSLTIGNFTFDEEMKGEIKINNEGKYFKYTHRLKANTEINRARYNPFDPQIIATKNADGKIYLYNLEKEENPFAILKGHDKEGYGLSWNKYKQGLLLSGSYDNKICVYDLERFGSKKIQPKKIFNIHNNVVEDVEWLPQTDSVFGSVSDDKKFILTDLRTKNSITEFVTHTSETNTLAFNPKNNNFLLTGSNDLTIKLWDLRNHKLPVHIFKNHTQAVYRLIWYPFETNIFASSEDGTKIYLWDINKIGGEKFDMYDDSPTELIFTHSEHRSVIRDFSWNPTIPFVISSTDDDHKHKIIKIKKKAIHFRQSQLKEDFIEL